MQQRVLGTFSSSETPCADGQPMNCDKGCLFNASPPSPPLRNIISDRANDAVLAQVLRDPSERDELSASEPAQKRRMMAALAAAQPSVIKTPQIPDDPACCAAAAQKYGGFLGPYIV